MIQQESHITSRYVCLYVCVWVHIYIYIYTQNFKNLISMLNFRQFRGWRKWMTNVLLWKVSENAIILPWDFLPKLAILRSNTFSLGSGGIKVNKSNLSLAALPTCKHFCISGADFPFLNQMLISPSTSPMLNKCVVKSSHKQW